MWHVALGVRLGKEDPRTKL